jgi:hypothetical protein
MDAHVPQRARRRGLMRFFPLLLLALLCGTAPAAGRASERATKNVVLVTLDGVRVQDLFGGLDEVVATHDEKQVYSDMAAMRARFGGATPEERRSKLMPEFWTRLAPQGVVFGNPARGNHVKVQNGVYWSTPGYVEMLTGAPRPEVVDNEERRYAHRTALELARSELGLEFGQVAAIGSWDGYANAAASTADAFVMVGAYDDVPDDWRTDEIDFLNELRRDVMGLWEEGSNDALTYRIAEAYLEKNRPRVLWVALVNSDDWAHADRYDRYLAYLHRADAMLGDLWTTIESLDSHRGRTTLIVTTDHGRGRTGTDWAEHDTTIPGSDEAWLAVIGPDTPDTGEVSTTATHYQGQVAATLLELLGIDYRRLGEDARPPAAGALAE